MMCWLSRPKQGDVVTDPFCGYGSIPEQRLKHFPQADFYAFDISAEAVASTRAKTGPGCHVRRAELRRIPDLLPETGVDAVITDPPWGLYAETALPPENFHREMIAVFGKILKPGGIIIILTARKEELSRAAASSDCLVITGTIPVLVSGRKAAIFTLVKDGACQAGDTAIH
jgi:tRNA G10  N-methylase Trm11